jgi:magnesium chelatase subunit H
MSQNGGSSGPPAPIKAILSKFSSGKEEDKINGYLKMLKVGPDLLKFIPGEKAGDLRVWLESYRFWNQVNLFLISDWFCLVLTQYNHV